MAEKDKRGDKRKIKVNMHLSFEIGKTVKLEEGTVTFIMENKEVRNVKLGEAYDIDEDSEEYVEEESVPPTESSSSEGVEEIPVTQKKIE